MGNVENREIAVKLTGVKKRYRLGQIGGTTLRADLQSWWARIRKKEDPNVKIGVDQRLIGQTFMALNGIDLTIYKGEAVGIIGGNGAGKSTMLKLLSRVTAPTEGDIDIYGRIASMLEVGTGFNTEMTGRENIYLNGAILGMTKEEIDSKMDEIIEFSEVKDFIDTPVKRYSSGMYVKLAFSVAAHLDAEIMIMDEVLAVGDINFQQKCLKKMREAAKVDGRTVLYVSHNMSTIRQLCDRCIVLSQGKVIFEGDVEEAIAIYSNVQKTELKSHYDLSDKRRLGATTDKFQMLSLDLKDNYLDKNSPLKFTIEVESKEACEHVVCRMAIKDQMSGPIGTTFSEQFSLKKGKNTKTFILDTSSMIYGEYACTIVMLEHKDQMLISHDAIADAMAFTIKDGDLPYDFKWHKNANGCVQFPTLQVDKD